MTHSFPTRRSSDLRDREYAALVDPGEPRRREGGGHRHVEAAIAIEKRRRSLGSVKAFLHHDEHRHLGAVLRFVETLFDAEVGRFEGQLGFGENLAFPGLGVEMIDSRDRKSTRLNSS